MILLTRDDFRNSVFERDSYKCVICGSTANAAHHILERRLFNDGGYYLNNGVSLCEQHHIQAEQTIISCDELRFKAGITEVIIPEHFYPDQKYDKWGNIVLATGQRIKGELFYEEPVQKVLGQGKFLDIFSKYVKYQRTYHLPWSNLLKDDRMLKDDHHFHGKRVIASLKMDGENTTIYSDYMHARSLEPSYHESRNWVKGLAGNTGYLLDEDMRICGENLYAEHTVTYDDLPTYFMMFSIWNENTCMSWDDTVEYASILGIETVPVFYDGIYDVEKIIAAFEPFRLKNEGYVIRIADEFKYIDFRRSIAKFVRPEFREKLNNNDEGHWMSKKVIPNKLRQNLSI